MLIAVTGGIGSGKSEVMHIVASLGGKILSADDISRELYSDESYIKAIKSHFPEATDSEGKIDKKKLGNIVFNDKEKLSLLNSISHPLIMEELFKRAETIGGKVFIEIPLLFETGIIKPFSKIWLVVADSKIREKRTADRDGVSSEYVRDVMKNQYDYEKCKTFITDIIENNSTREALYIRVKKLYDSLS